MRKLLFLLLFTPFLTLAQTIEEEEGSHSLIKNIYTTALSENQGYKWLKKLTAQGPRLTGSPEATEAVKEFALLMDSLGFKTTLQRVTVPRWVRGDKEVASYIIDGENINVNVCALGGSVATPENGLKGMVVEINSFEELESFTDELTGKIAFYNIPMDPSFINTFHAYSNAAKQRFVGALEASKKGATGVIVRSLSSSINDYPHTGSMTYAGAEKKIPAIAISTADAEKLSRDLMQDPALEFSFKMNCRNLDSTYSYNLIADLKGREKPEEIILIGGHIDSWDLATGAHDDGAGVIHALEAAYLLKELNLLPKRTIRVVFFMNEEFGLNGAKEYAKRSVEEKTNHVIAIESDAGGFSPRGISMVAPDTVISRIKDLRGYLEPYGIHQFSQTGSGADISQLYAEDIILIGLRPDSHRYFEIHHSALDSIDQVNARELEIGSATLAALIHLMDKYDITAK